MLEIEETSVNLTGRNPCPADRTVYVCPPKDMHKNILSNSTLNSQTINNGNVHQ